MQQRTSLDGVPRIGVGRVVVGLAFLAMCVAGGAGVAFAATGGDSTDAGYAIVVDASPGSSPVTSTPCPGTRLRVGG